jgi:hypothetical protein
MGEPMEDDRMTRFNIEHTGTGKIIATCDRYEDAVLEVLTYDGGTVDFERDEENNDWTLTWTELNRRAAVVARVDGGLAEDAARIELLRAVKLTESELLWINGEEV